MATRTTLSIGNEPCVVDVHGQLRRHIERYLSDSVLCSTMAAAPSLHDDSRHGSKTGCVAGVGLPLPNYPATPKVGINQFWYPSGATRWGFGYFLMSNQAKTKVVDKNAHKKDAKTVDLLLRTVASNENKKTEIKTRVSILSPRPVNVAAREDELLWLVPVVDERYWWQNEPFNYYPVQGDTWTDLFREAGAAISKSIKLDSIDSAYMSPDLAELNRQSDNAAVIIDAMAHSVGLRIIREFDGTIRALNASNSKKRLDSNLQDRQNGRAKVAGGQFTVHPLPESIFTEARALYAGCCDAYGFTWGYQYDNGGKKKQAGSNVIIHSTAFADTTTMPGGVPENNTKLQSLADKIGEDWLAWKEQAFDVTFSLIPKWEPTGFDNGLLIDYAGEIEQEPVRIPGEFEPGGEPLALFEPPRMRQLTTRVIGHAENFGVHQQLSQDPDLSTACRFYFEIAPGQILFPGQQARARLLVWNNTLAVWQYRNPIFEAPIHDLSLGHGRNFGIPGERFVCRYAGDLGRFEIVGSYGLRRRGRVLFAPWQGDGALGQTSIQSWGCPYNNACQVAIISGNAVSPVWVWANHIHDQGTQEIAYWGRNVTIDFHPDYNGWVIDWIDKPCRVLHFKVSQSSFDSANQIIDVEELDYWNGWSPQSQHALTDPSDPNPELIKVWNPQCGVDEQSNPQYVFSGEADQCGWAYIDPPLNRYYIFQMTCPAPEEEA